MIHRSYTVGSKLLLLLPALGRKRFRFRSLKRPLSCNVWFDVSV